MVEFPFNWQLKFSGYLHENILSHLSDLKLNPEWSLTCFGSTFGGRHPDIVEIHRNSTDGEILVSGTFNLMSDQVCILQKQFTKLIEDGVSTTQIRLQYNYNSFNNQSYSINGILKIPAALKSLLELSSDFERLLDPQATLLSDVILKCGTDSFSVHKIILSARSPVFAAMFTNEMKENRDNIVEIIDISSYVLKAMLTYIYTGQTGELPVQYTGELLFAADKYQLLGLRKICIDCLKSCVSVENVLEILDLGYLHDENLKVFAVDFICNRLEEFKVLEETPGWKNLRENKPVLAMEILIHLVTSKDAMLKRYKSHPLSS